jgi:hypothetical protein
MKRLLSLLFNHDHKDWWTLHESDGADPPNERTFMFTYANLIAVIKRKLGKIDDEARP